MQPNYLNNSYFIIPFVVESNMFIKDVSFVKSTAKTVGFMNILTLCFVPKSPRHMRYLISCAKKEKNMYVYYFANNMLQIEFLTPIKFKIDFMNIAQFGYDAVTKRSMQMALTYYTKN